MDRFNKINFELNKELSAEDFQEKLSQWLEEQGILPGLRTYLRHQLISALKHTHLSSDYLNRKRNHLSPKDAAFNLLVVEYLLEQNYQYTVSIFYSEEPQLGRLPIQLRFPTEGVGPVKCFKEKEVEDILESLNLAHSSKFIKNVIDTYFNRKKPLSSNSLLKAIFRSIAGQNESPIAERTELSAGDAHDAEEESTINRSSERTNRISVNKTNQPKEKYCHHEKSMVYQEEKSLDWENKQIQIEKRIQDAVYKVQEELEKKMSERRKSLEDDLMAKEQNLLEMMNHLRDQQVKLQGHMKDIQKKEEMLNHKERKLDEMQEIETVRLATKHNEIISSQQKLEGEYQRLRQEKNTIVLLQKEMEASHKQILEVAHLLGNSQIDLNMLQSLNTEKQQKIERQEMLQPDRRNSFSTSDPFHLVQSVRAMQENAVQACQRAICELKDKNTKLQVLANEQQSKINTLSTTASSLHSQLEDATAALRLLSSRDDYQSKVHLSDAPERHVTFPASLSEGRSQLPPEEHDIPQDSMQKKVQPRRKIQRMNAKIVPSRQKSDESSTDSSPTKEILRESRRRLQQLVIESDEVDRQYYKHLSEGFRMSSFNLSNAINPQPLEREKNHSIILPKYNHQIQSHQTLVQFGNQRSTNREEMEPFVNQLTIHMDPTNNHPTNTMQNPTSNVTGVQNKFQPEAMIFKKANGNNLYDTIGNSQVNPNILIADRSIQMASINQNTLEDNRTTSPQIPFTHKQIEIGPHAETSKEQLLSRSRIQKEDQFDPLIHKDERHLLLTEKNHLSALKVISDNNVCQIHREEEKTDKNNLESKSDEETQVNSEINILNNKVNDKNANISAEEQRIDELVEEANDSMLSSSAKFSIGANDSKAGEDGDFW